MCVHVGRCNGDYSFSVFLERPIYLFVRLTYQSRRRINRRRSCRWCDDGDVPIRKQSGLIPIVFTRTHAHSYRQPTLTMVLCMTGVWTPKAAAVEMAIATSRRANRDFIIVFVFNFTKTGLLLFLFLLVLLLVLLLLSVVVVGDGTAVVATGFAVLCQPSANGLCCPQTRMRRVA